LTKTLLVKTTFSGVRAFSVSYQVGY